MHKENPGPLVLRSRTKCVTCGVWFHFIVPLFNTVCYSYLVSILYLGDRFYIPGTYFVCSESRQGHSSTRALSLSRRTRDLQLFSAPTCKRVSLLVARDVTGTKHSPPYNHGICHRQTMPYHDGGFFGGRCMCIKPSDD